MLSPHRTDKISGRQKQTGRNIGGFSVFSLTEVCQLIAEDLEHIIS